MIENLLGTINGFHVVVVVALVLYLALTAKETPR